MRTLYPFGWLRLFILGVILVFFGCVTIPVKLPPQEINLNIKGVDAVKVEEEGDEIARNMVVSNEEGSLSSLSFYCGNKLFTKLFSNLTVGDVMNLWNDRIIVTETSDIREWHLFINSGGGGAFAGLALADEIEKAKKAGFIVIGHASGIVASAAVPVFVVCSERIAGPGTFFMVHETAIFKWPGMETASDIRSQTKLMNLLQDRYFDKMTQYTKLTREQWEEKEGKTTYFSAQEALDWGLVDRIE